MNSTNDIELYNNDDYVCILFSLHQRSRYTRFICSEMADGTTKIIDYTDPANAALAVAGSVISTRKRLTHTAIVHKHELASMTLKNEFNIRCYLPVSEYITLVDKVEKDIASYDEDVLGPLPYRVLLITNWILRSFSTGTIPVYPVYPPRTHHAESHRILQSLIDKFGLARRLPNR